MRGIDGFSHAPGDREQRLLSELLADIFAEPARWERAGSRDARELLQLESRAAALPILKADDALQRALVLATARRLEAATALPGYSTTTCFVAYSREPVWHHVNVLELLLARLLKRRCAYTASELVTLLGVAGRQHGVSTLIVLGHLERQLEGFDAAARAALNPALLALQKTLPRWRETAATHERLGALLATLQGKAVPGEARQTKGTVVELPGGNDPWLVALRAEGKLPQARHWRALLPLVFEEAGRSQPRKSWLAQVGAALAAEGAGADFVASFERVLVAVPELPSSGAKQSARQLAGEAGALLQALAWCAAPTAAIAPASLVQTLARASVALYARVEDIGARCARAGNGCITALGLIGSDEAARALAGLTSRLEYHAGQQATQRALAQLAERRGLDASALASAVATDGDVATMLDVAALAPLRAREPGPALLSALLGTWRETPASALAEAIERLSARLAVVSAPPAGSKAVRLAAWQELAAQRDPLDLPRLLAEFDLDNQRSAAEQLRALEAWPADPRLATALCAIVERPPFRHRRTWQLLFGVLLAQDDPRTAGRLAAIDETTRGRSDRDPWRVLLSETRRALHLAAPSAVEPTAAAIALLDELVPLARPTGAAVTRVEQREALLADIYAQPQDDDLRRLYADLLLEAGEPRGELIALQLTGEANAVQRKRERELLAESHDWLGPLGAVLQRGGLRWARGFPVAARIDGERLQAASDLIGHPAWSTFEALEVRGWNVPRAAFVHPVLRGLRSLVGVDFETTLALCRDSVAWSLTQLGTTLYRDDDDPELESHWRTIVEARGLPALAVLETTSELDAERLEQLLEGPLGRRLERLEVAVSWQAAVPLVLRVARRQSAPTRVVLRETFRHFGLALERGAGGRWSKLSIEPAKGADVESHRHLHTLLAQLPPEDVNLVGLER